VEKNSSLSECSIREVLLNAHKIDTVFDVSPLVIVGIHRLLTAIMQDILSPKKSSDLVAIWNKGYFDPDLINQFGDMYSHAFDLYSKDKPFYQSLKTPDSPNDKAQTVSYLSPLVPSGESHALFFRGDPLMESWCSTCVARELLTIAPFATVGGASVNNEYKRMSINRSDSIYVIPGGSNLFEQLVYSLLLPINIPKTASKKEDRVWWRREDQVDTGDVLLEVGYLHSLTFQPRALRLYPQQHDSNVRCSHCNRPTDVTVSQIYYQGGEYRNRKLSTWIDPFIAYYTKNDNIHPITARKGRSLWREFTALFSPTPTRDNIAAIPPAIIYQMYNEMIDYMQIYPFTCVAVITQKTKFEEVVQGGFSVPMAALSTYDGSDAVDRAIALAGSAEKATWYIFKTHYDVSKVKNKKMYRDATLEYWAMLEDRFNEFVLSLSLEIDKKAWGDSVLEACCKLFDDFAKMSGIHSLESSESFSHTRAHCRVLIERKIKEYIKKQ